MFVNYLSQARGNGEFPARINGRLTTVRLLDKFSDRNNFQRNKRPEKEVQNDGGIELNLGLSLNGKFGVDPIKKVGIELMRPSSVQTTSLVGKDTNLMLPPPPSVPTSAVPIGADYTALSRTFSLPTDVEAENWRKRKELQSMRRLEAKKRRMEKIKSLITKRSARGKVDSDGNSSDEAGSNSNSNGNGPGLVRSINGNVRELWLLGSAGGSPISTSPAITEVEPQPNKALNIELKLAPNLQSSEPKDGDKPQEVIPKSGADVVAAEGNKVAAPEGNKTMKDLMLEMPCVSTTGNGANGQKIDGFLYRYGRGEEVKIVCVCHGSFLTPAEFVKHGGGDEVENPLRHIVINPSAIL